MTTRTEARLLLNMRAAAAYLGVSRSHFYEHIRPVLPVHDMSAPDSPRSMPRWSVDDLEAYAKTRRREKRAS